MKGLAIPVGVNPSGGAQLVDGEGNDAKIIKMSLTSDDTDNAFQQNIALGHDMVFDLNDVTLRAKIRRGLQRIFKEFEIQKRYKLKTDTIKWTEDSVNQELILEFKYINLESDEEKAIVRRFSPKGA